MDNIMSSNISDKFERLRLQSSAVRTQTAVGMATTDDNVTHRRAADSCSGVWTSFQSFVFGLFCGLTLAMFVCVLSLAVQLNAFKSELDDVKTRCVQLQSAVTRASMTGPATHAADMVNALSSILQESEDLDKPTSNFHVIAKRNAIRKRTGNKRHSRHSRRPSIDGSGAVSRLQVEAMIADYLQPMLHPSAHMSILTQNGSAVNEEGAIRWTAHRSNTSHNNVFEYDGDYSRLLVLSSGTYFVYAQIMYNGRTARSQLTCSHVVKLLPAETESSLTSGALDLLYGSTTQVQLGGPIRVLPDGRPETAFDNSFVGGVFQLEEGDRLVVQLDSYSQNCRVVSHAQSSFLGAFRIQSPVIGHA